MSQTAIDERTQITGILESLPAPLVRQVLDFASFLRLRYLIEHDSSFSTEWTDEDIRDWMNARFDHMERECPWDDSAEDPNNGEPG